MDTFPVRVPTVDVPSVPPPTLTVGLADARPTIPTPRRRAALTSLAPPPLHTPSRALVLVATLDRAGIQSLTRRLLGHASVRGVRRPFDLIYAIESHPGAQPVVVIDCCVPSMEPDTVATMMGALSSLPQVVLWGASEPVYAALRKASPSARSWMRLGPSATDADVAELVNALL